MKVTTFVSCVTFVSFLSSAGSISLKNNQTSWKVCTEKVIQTIFGDEALHYVFKGSSDLLPIHIRNPMAVINTSIPILSARRKVSNNVILEVRNLDYLERCIVYLRSVGIWSLFGPIIARVLLITDHILRIEKIFDLLWSYGITNLAVLSINKDEEASSFLFTANPYDVQNNSGKVLNRMHVQNCVQAISDTIPHPIKDYHRCSIDFRSSSLTRYLDEFNRRTFTITMAVEMLNASLVKTPMDRAKIIVGDGQLSSRIQGGPRMSHVYIRDVLVWVVPPTNAISALEILAVNFELEVWILVLVVFALFSLAWYVLDKFKTSVGEIVLKTFGITLFGSTSRITQSSKLRFVILCYIIYSVHIQTAYVSNLMRLMTSPPTRRPIHNLKELLKADIPICLDSSALFVMNSNRFDKLDEIYNKINLRLCPITTSNPRVLLETWSARPNFSIAIPLKTLHAQALNLRLRTPNYFIDNHVLPPSKQTFVGTGWQTSFIIDSLNIVIDRLTESGLYDKLDRDRQYYEDSQRRELPQEEEVVALSLEHLNGIFIVFCFGVVLSVMAFIGELLAHRFLM